jgi:hypothetical protein
MTKFRESLMDFTFYCCQEFCHFILSWDYAIQDDASMSLGIRCYDTQHDNIPHNDTQHYDTQHNDTQHNETQHNATWHNDTKFNDIQHNDRQHNDAISSVVSNESRHLQKLFK